VQPRTAQLEWNGWPELLTDQQLAEFLNVPFDPGHVKRLRSREKLPHVCFDIGGEKYYRYPLDGVRGWVRGRVRIGNKLAEKSGKTPLSTRGA
jgi:hypothetical protein